MKILVLLGPNLNLISIRASRLGDRITLDKINRKLRLHVRNTEIELKILQTQKRERAIAFLQKNRNLADGLLILPASWAAANHELKETLNIINLTTVQVLLSAGYGEYGPSDSIFTETCKETVIGHPEDSIVEGLDKLIYILKDEKK